MSAQGNVVYEVRAKVRCSTCDGSGAINGGMAQCPACGGAGVILRWVTLQEAIAASLVPPEGTR